MRKEPFPDCAEDCEILKVLGAGECESVCSEKFCSVCRHELHYDELTDEPSDKAYFDLDDKRVFCPMCGYPIKKKVVHNAKKR